MTALTLLEARPISEFGHPALMFNLGGPNDSIWNIFIDRPKQCRNWWQPNNSVWPDANLDANLNMASLPSGVTEAYQYLFSSLGTTDANAAGLGGNLAGEYVAWWTGGPTTCTFNGYSPTGVTAGTRTVTFTVGSDISGANLRLEFTGLGVSGVITEIHCVKTSNMAAYNAGELFDPDWLAILDPEKIANLRFMVWMGTNGSTQEVWADRPLLAWKTWDMFGKGVPLEAMVALCNQIGIAPWFCLPHLADETYQTNFATYVRDNLSPALSAINEFSNECWNFSFGQTQDMIAAGEAFFGTDDGDEYIQFYAVKVAKMAQVIDAVYGSNKRYQIALSWHAPAYSQAEVLLTAPKWEDVEPAEYITPGSVVDFIAIAPYFGAGIAGDAGIWTALQVSQAAAITYIAALCPAALADSKTWVEGWKLVADEYEIPLHSYENGFHFELNSSGNDNLFTDGTRVTPGAGVLDLFYAASYHASIAPYYTEHMDNCREAGMRYFNAFQLDIPFSRYGAWGLYRWLGDTNARLTEVLDWIDDNPRWWPQINRRKSVTWP